MDTPHPLSVYGRTKLAGERFVRELVPEHFIVRTSYVYGAGDDYASGAVERLRRGESAGGIRDRIGSPTFVRHLASIGCCRCCSPAGSAPITWPGPSPPAGSTSSSAPVTIGGLPGTVDAQEFASLGLVAPRPANSALASAYLEHIGIEPFPALDEAVAEWLGSGPADGAG